MTESKNDPGPADASSKRNGHGLVVDRDDFLSGLADALSGDRMPHACPTNVRTRLPSVTTLVDLAETIRAVLFPGYFASGDVTVESARFHAGARLDRVLELLPDQIVRGFEMTRGPLPGLEAEAASLTRRFLARLPDVQALLASDVRAAFEGDPAATCPEEAIFCYPGLRAVTYQRLAHELYVLGVPLLPRILTEHAHSATGIDIHPGASIGERFFIDHGTGVVIGETCVIGKGVRIYQGVTLGAKSFPLDEHGNPIKGIPRHPILEDDVVIYAGATILGRITVGQGSVIGGGVWLTHSVPPGSILAQARERTTGTPGSTD